MITLDIATCLHPFSKNKQRLTALYINSGAGDEEMLDILLEGGADISIKDEERATPLQVSLNLASSLYFQTQDRCQRRTSELCIKNDRRNLYSKGALR